VNSGGLEWNQMVDFCDHGNESSGSVGAENLKNYQLYNGVI